jgi:hypothetical protein
MLAQAASSTVVVASTLAPTDCGNVHAAQSTDLAATLRAAVEGKVLLCPGTYNLPGGVVVTGSACRGAGSSRPARSLGIRRAGADQEVIGNSTDRLRRSSIAFPRAQSLSTNIFAAAMLDLPPFLTLSAGVVAA